MRLLTFLYLLIMNISGGANSLIKSQAMLHYIERTPKVKTKNAPVVILLHGVGSNEKDLFSFAQRLPDNFWVISVRAPYSLGNDRYAWYEVDFSSGKPIINSQQADQSRKFVMEFIDQRMKNLNLEGSDVYVCGFSQGGVMAYSLGLLNPNRIKGIVIFSGRIMDEVKPYIVVNDNLKELKVFISHGSQDTILNLQYADNANKYLNQWSIHTTFKVYPEGHSISNDMIVDMMNWLTNISKY